MIDVVVALEQLHLGDAREKLSLRAGLPPPPATLMQNIRTLSCPLIRPFPVDRQDIGFAAGTAERGEPGAIQVLDHPERAGLEIRAPRQSAACRPGRGSASVMRPVGCPALSRTTSLVGVLSSMPSLQRAAIEYAS